MPRSLRIRLRLVSSSSRRHRLFHTSGGMILSAILHRWQRRRAALGMTSPCAYEKAEPDEGLFACELWYHPKSAYGTAFLLDSDYRLSFA